MSLWGCKVPREAILKRTVLVDTIYVREIDLYPDGTLIIHSVPTKNFLER